MNYKLHLLGAGVSLTVGLLTACHDDDYTAPTNTTPAPAVSVSQDTAQVLALAQQTSETEFPFVVNGGVYTLNDTSDTSAPIAVNAM